MVRVLLVDDQNLIRDGIKSLLQLSGAVTVVGECVDGTEVVAAIARHEPDVVLLDISMPKQDGLATLKQLKQLQITTPCLVLTTFDDHQRVLESVTLGAKGFLLKDVALETLVTAIEQVAQGNSFISPAITASLLSNQKRASGLIESNPAREPLTPREIEVLRLVAGGFSNREIAEALHKSEGTVKNHVSNILSKFGARDRTRAVLQAIELDIL